MLIHINGMPGVGKLTVAGMLAGKFGMHLVDNHSLINAAYASGFPHGSEGYMAQPARHRRGRIPGPVGQQGRPARHNDELPGLRMRSRPGTVRRNRKTGLRPQGAFRSRSFVLLAGGKPPENRQSRSEDQEKTDERRRGGGSPPELHDDTSRRPSEPAGGGYKQFIRGTDVRGGFRPHTKASDRFAWIPASGER